MSHSNCSDLPSPTRHFRSVCTVSAASSSCVVCCREQRYAGNSWVVFAGWASTTNFIGVGNRANRHSADPERQSYESDHALSCLLGRWCAFRCFCLLLWGRDYLCLTKISIDMNMLDAHLATCCHAAKRSGHRTAQMVSRVVLGEGVVQPGRANPPGRLIWTIIWQA